MDYTRCNAHHQCLSVDAHFQNGDVTMLLSLLHIRAAYMLNTDNREQITSRLTCFLPEPDIVDPPLTLIFRMRLLPCPFLLYLWRLPIHWSWITDSKSLSNYLAYKTRNRSRSIDSQYQNVAVTVSRSPVPIKVSYLLIMNNSKQISSQLSCLQVQKSLTLQWQWFWEWGFHRVAIAIRYKGCQYFGYTSVRPNRLPIVIPTIPKIIVTLLNLMFSIGLSPCRFFFCLSTQPIHVLRTTACISLSNELTYKTKNCWHSIHTHLKHDLPVVLWIIILYK